MTIFAVANTKGGVGKSTDSVQLATGLVARGASVGLVDGDTKQNSAMLSMTNRINNGFPGIKTFGVADGASLRSQVRLQAPDFDHIVIDVGAKDSGTMRGALTVAEVLLIPFTPESYDVWEFTNMIALVQEALELRPFKVIPFLNKADTFDGDKSDNALAVEEVSSHGFPVAPVRLVSRKAIARASAAGLNVADYKPLDPKARDEVDAWIDHILEVSKG
jgi:chromosome partitioning protein